MQPATMAPAAVIGIVVTYFILFMVLIVIPHVIGNYFLARRVGGNPVLWAILTCIPGVNLIFFTYVFYRTVFVALDRLHAIGRRAGLEMP